MKRWRGSPSTKSRISINGQISNFDFGVGRRVSFMGGGVGAMGGTGTNGVINSGASSGVGTGVGIGLMTEVGVTRGALIVGVIGDGLGGDTVAVAVTTGVVVW